MTNKRLPLRFNSLRDEFNFICVLHAVNFGSSFFPGKPVECSQDGILWHALRGCMGAHLSGRFNRFDQDFLSAVTDSDVEEWFGLPRATEVPIAPDTPIYKSVDSAHKPLVQCITRVLNELGWVLRNHAQVDMFEYLLGELNVQDIDERNVSPLCISASRLLEKLTSSRLTVFRDSYSSSNVMEDESEIILSSKAQRLIMHLHSNFLNRGLCIEDLSKLTIAVNHLVPCALAKLKLLHIPDPVLKKWNENSPLDSKEEVLIRCNSLLVCQSILEKSEGEGINKATLLLALQNLLENEAEQSQGCSFLSSLKTTIAF